MTTLISIHWSKFIGVASECQALALDRIAQKLGQLDGLELLMRLTGKSEQEVARMDRAELRRTIDRAFELRDNKRCKI